MNINCDIYVPDRLARLLFTQKNDRQDKEQIIRLHDKRKQLSTVIQLLYPNYAIWQQQKSTINK